MAQEKKTVLHEFACGVFPRKLWVVKKPPRGYLEKHFQSINGEKLQEFSRDEAMAVTYAEVCYMDTNQYGILVVLLDGNIKISDCAHEATHVAMGIYAGIGEKISTDYQEVMAYLVGYVTDCIYQVARNKTSCKDENK